MLARLRPYILLFLALTVVYHADFRPIDSSDSLPASLTPLALILDHTIHLDRFIPWLHGHVWYARSVTHRTGGHYYSGGAKRPSLRRFLPFLGRKKRLPVTDDVLS